MRTLLFTLCSIAAAVHPLAKVIQKKDEIAKLEAASARIDKFNKFLDLAMMSLNANRDKAIAYTPTAAVGTTKNQVYIGNIHTGMTLSDGGVKELSLTFENEMCGVDNGGSIRCKGANGWVNVASGYKSAEAYKGGVFGIATDGSLDFFPKFDSPNVKFDIPGVTASGVDYDGWTDQLCVLEGSVCKCAEYDGRSASNLSWKTIMSNAMACKTSHGKVVTMTANGNVAVYDNGKWNSLDAMFKVGSNKIDFDGTYICGITPDGPGALVCLYDQNHNNGFVGKLNVEVANPIIQGGELLTSVHIFAPAF